MYLVLRTLRQSDLTFYFHGKAGICQRLLQYLQPNSPFILS